MSFYLCGSRRKHSRRTTSRWFTRHGRRAVVPGALRGGSRRKHSRRATSRHTRCWDTALDNGESCCRRSQPGSRKRRAHRLSARASRPLVETALVGAREPQRRAHRLSVRASWPPVVTARSGTEQHRGSSARLVVTQRPCVWSREATWAFASLVCTYEPDVSCESGPVQPGPGRRL